MITFGLLTCRFLAGEISLEGIVTHNLLDTWTAVGSNQNKSGFTFNALDSELVKRVNQVICQIVVVVVVVVIICCCSAFFS